MIARAAHASMGFHSKLRHPPMDQKYQTWIDNKINGEPENARNRCASWTEQMVKEFPELRRVAGWIETWIARSEHWWCETSTGEIVDPTVIQFKSTVVGYHEYKGPAIIGKCMNCGSLCFEGYCPVSVVCSKDCGIAMESDWGHGTIFVRDDKGNIIKNWKELEEMEYAGDLPG